MKSFLLTIYHHVKYIRPIRRLLEVPQSKIHHTPASTHQNSENRYIQDEISQLSYKPTKQTINIHLCIGLVMSAIQVNQYMTRLFQLIRRSKIA